MRAEYGVALVVILFIYQLIDLQYQHQRHDPNQCSISSPSSPQLTANGTTKGLAIIRPFIEKDLLVLLSDLSNWTTPEYFPCRLRSKYFNQLTKKFSRGKANETAEQEIKGEDFVASDRPIDLIFFYSYNLTLEYHWSRILLQFSEKSNWRKCFRSIKMLDMNLNKNEDRYLGDGGPHVSGPVVMFFSLFWNTQITSNYDYFFLMEPDTNPVKDFWLDKIYDESYVDKKDFWMKGTIYSGPKYAPGRDQAAYYTYHINGNGIYKLNDPHFNQYLADVKKIEGVGNSFDVSIFIHRWKNFTRFSKVAHRFVYAPFIRNYGVSSVNLNELRINYSLTYVIHKKRACDICDP